MSAERTVPATMGFQYVVLRCVPRVDREEFVNVGVVLYCQQADFLATLGHVDEARVAALHAALDCDAVRSALAAAVAQATCFYCAAPGGR